MYKVSILFLLSFFNISFGCSRNKTNTDSNDKQDTCKYKIYFDKYFLADKNAVVEDKEIEKCYLAVKNGKVDIGGYTKKFKVYDFFNFECIKDHGLMRIEEKDNALEFTKVTKDNADTDGIYFFGGYDGSYRIDFVIFKNINEAKRLNIIYEITPRNFFDKYIDDLLTK